MTRAVVFDLFETLVDYDDTRSREFSSTVAQLCDGDSEGFHEVWLEGRPVIELDDGTVIRVDAAGNPTVTEAS